MLELFKEMIGWLINLLPHSPFVSFIDSLSGVPYLPELNWFLPVSEMIAISEVWLAAIALYYIYVVIMRAIGLIGS